MNPDLKHCCVIIPAYKPSESLINLVQTLGKHNLDVVVVNDGSGEKYEAIFFKLKQFKFVHIYTHAINMGKGAALKSAFNYILTERREISYVVTADADGQHRVDDIVKVLNRTISSPAKITLGIRSFNSKDVPFRSAFGNIWTKYVLRLMTGLKLEDTQTGLRAMSVKFLYPLLRIRSNRYEFELDMLLTFHKNDTGFNEVPIATVYIDNNKSSHFNPILDSFKIYFVLVRFCSSSILSAVVDNIVFAFAYFFMTHIFYATVIGRVVSGSMNFVLNRSFVFNSSKRISVTLVQYCVLALGLLYLSAKLVEGLNILAGMNVYGAKIIVETFLFIVSFGVQRDLIFKRR